MALIPGVLALLPEHASLVDPVAELRAAVAETLAWLGDEVEVIGSASGRRVAEAMLASRTATAGAVRSVLAVGNGSACRTEKAPGFLDDRAEAFDADLGRALTAPDPDALRALDTGLAEELWADVAVLPSLAELIAGATASVSYDDLPYGVQYWVIRWEAQGAGA